MASVTVLHPHQNAKSCSIKTTPSTSLRQVVADALTAFRLDADPNTFGLKNGRNMLDLGLNMRFANLPQGAKLQLIPVAAYSVAPGPVNVALQTPEGERLVDKFAIDTTLWGVLRTWETRNQNLNLTNRKGVVERGMLKLKKDVYMMPVCVMMNKEVPDAFIGNVKARLKSCAQLLFCTVQFSTVESLQRTTLQQAGLSSGSGVIRVLLRACDLSEMIGSRSASPAPVAAAPTPAAASPAASPNISPQAEASANVVPPPSQAREPASTLAAPEATSTDATPSLPASTLPTVNENTGSGPAPMEIDIEPLQVLPMKDYGSSVSHYVEEALVKPTPMEVDVTKEPNNASCGDSGLLERSGSTGNSAAATEHSGGPATPPPLEDESAMKVFYPPPDGVPYNQIVLPDSFYQLTSTELRVLLARSGGNSGSGSDAPLMTKAMRDREAALKRNKYPKTMTRVRFADRRLVQCGFMSGDKISALYAALKPLLANPARAFVLYTTPPMRVLDASQTFWEAGLAPACLVYFKWADGEGDGGDDWLASDWRAKMQPFPESSVSEASGVPTASNAEVAAAAAASRESKRPAWLPAVPSSSSSSSRPQSSGSSGGQDGGGLFGDERDGGDAGRGGRGDDGGANGSGSKKPKWFKIGK
ncbi:Tether containing UBX domain for GLUT4 [Geranomyces variabilis]|uniref:Tether containing UBX domain for GLUT4 n=1 Tax=Geranomyces variabilis TaxID=109894 RepID=A0AAD5TGH4_9FUNG|nr:Tether containing UBX domain for GLUT4 [Geranomyces variabilis]